MNNQVFRALADPTRREILRLLTAGELSAGSLAERFDMTKPTVSHHFTVLKAADLITSRREGQQIIYSLNTTVAEDLLAWLFELFGSEQTSAVSPRLAATKPSQAAASSSKKRLKGET